jgi:hypothetical protein
LTTLEGRGFGMANLATPIKFLPFEAHFLGQQWLILIQINLQSRFWRGWDFSYLDT